MASILLTIDGVTQSFGERRLFHIDHLAIHQGDRIGLIGRNGAGKSTLIKLLAGQSVPEEGTVSRKCPIGYAPQFGLTDGVPDKKALRDFSMTGRENDAATLSGGETARLRLSQVPFGAPLLLLDEPTANLDAPGCRLFREKLLTQPSFLLVSHDRSLLDGVCNRIWLMEDGTVREYDGNYAAFQDARETEKITQARAHEQYTTELSHLKAAYQGVWEQSDRIRRAPARMGKSEARLHKMGGQGAKKKLDQQRKAIMSRIDRLEKVDAPRDEAALQLDFSLTRPPETRAVITVRGLNFSYGREPLLRDASFILENGRKTALLGPNGCGKTTLIRLIRGGDPAVRVTPKARLGFLSQDLSSVDDRLTVLENARMHCVQSETTMRTVLRRLLFAREVLEKPAATLSGGEKIKLCLCQLIVSDCNALILDEPTNYLDLPSLAALESVLREYPGTVLLVSHDDALVRHVADSLLLLECGRLTAFQGTLNEYRARQAPDARDVSLRRTALQMRLAELSCGISSASERDKPALTEAYAACLAEYRALSSGGMEKLS